MGKNEHDAHQLPKIAVIGNCILACMIFLTWIFVAIRGSEYIQGGYFNFDGMRFISLSFCLIFPFMMIAYRLWGFRPLRLYLVIFHILGGVIGYLLLSDYLLKVSLLAEPPYILTGLFLQDNLTLIVAEMMIYFVIFLINLLLLLTPAQIEGIPTGGVGENKLHSNKQFLWLTLFFTISFVGIALLLYNLHSNGLQIFLFGGYILNIFGAILTWWSSRGVYISSLEDHKNQQILKMKNGSMIYLLLSILLVIPVVIGLLSIENLDTFSLLGIILGNCIILGIGRIVWDYRKYPKRKSNKKEYKIFQKMLKSSLIFGFFSIFGGLTVFVSTFTYFLDVDRYNEFNAVAKLLICIAVTFPIMLAVLRKTNAKFLFIIAWSLILTLIVLELQVIEIAATSDWYLNPDNVISGFAFLQSWEHAFLTAIPIGIVFAVFFDLYQNYYFETHNHGIHFEVIFTLLIEFFLNGLLIGHDHRFSGPQSNEFNLSALEIFDMWSILFFVCMGVLLLIVILVFWRAYLLKYKQKFQKPKFLSRESQKIMKKMDITEVD